MKEISEELAVSTTRRFVARVEADSHLWPS
jgi:hypothetical protein